MSGCVGCRGHDDDGPDDTTLVGAFDGLHDGAAVGFNFPFDIAVVPDDPLTDAVEGGDIIVADYGTSQVMWVENPTDRSLGAAARPLFDGTSEGLRGATAISAGHHERTWVAFEQGGEGNGGGIVVLDVEGRLVTLLDGATDPDAFRNPGGLCFGGWTADGEIVRFFMVNLGDGTAWRIEASSMDATDAVLTRVGGGLAVGTPGNPGRPGAGLTGSKDLPEGGARGCAYAEGFLYVADAQNARIVRFEDADVADGVTGVALEDTPSNLVTYPTGVTINSEGHLIVISYDNAHAFVTLELPGGAFFDNGLHDLNVNAGNYGVAVAHQTIWFTRANNSNGTLRAITPHRDDAPSTAGPFPPQ
jgi:hypothetical protein